MILAALCPVVFAGLALWWRRWGVFLGVVSVNSSLYLAHAWFRGNADGAWWGTVQAIYVLLAFVSCIGAIVCFWRVRRMLRSDSGAALTPGRVLLPVLATASMIGLSAALYGLIEGAILRWPWREGLPLLAAALGGTFYLLCVGFFRRAPEVRARTEVALLVALALGCVLSGVISIPPADVQIVWTFEAPDRGLIYSTPRVDGDQIFVSVAHTAGLKQFGAVYCLDRNTGKRIWTFNRAGKMKQILSSPALDSGRLYVGEGLHEDTDCGMYCLDASTGQEIWRFATKSHVESSPRVADGCVFFGAGDDGVYCVDAATGSLRWNFPGLHVDATPALAGNRLYAGSAYGKPEMLCLDTATGRPLWRTPSDVSVFGSPTVADNQVFFGVGNGKLTRSVPNPAGRLACLDATTGAELWRFEVPDAVLAAPALAGDLVYFGSRDGYCYCLTRRDGREQWKKDFGSPVVAAPLISDNHLFAVVFGGTLHCLDARSGAALWHFDVGKHSRTTPQLVSSPALAHSADDTGPQLYLGTGLYYSINIAAVVYRLKAPVSRGP